MSKSKTKLRFAALIRVSTEKQKKQGESLRTQEKQLNEAVENLGGVIVAKYAGQEHATAGWEREQLEKLLSDAERKSRPFDAVIVADPSRWSRDNVASEIGLERLRNAGVRFFVLSTEHDLNSDDARLFLSMAATINAYQARVAVRKSLDNRVERAQGNAPASGSLPYGRTFNKKTKEWGIDLKAQGFMEEVAKRYLAGESIRKIALELGSKESTLYDRLEKCGDKLKVEFHSDTLNVHETIEMTIPPLLDAKTVKAIRAKARANQTYSHGQAKHKYLFSRMVFCEHCGSALVGQFDGVFKNRYYRHLKNSEDQKACSFRGNIRAEDLETIVIQHLFEMFGNPKAVQRAIEEAVPDMDKLNDLYQRHARLRESLEKIEAGRERVISLVGDDEISDADAKRKLASLRDRQTKLQTELDQLNEQLAYSPDPAAIQKVAEQATKTFRQYSNAKLVAKTKDANRDLDGMSWEDKRALVQMVFGGMTADGDRMGVYVFKTEGVRSWKYAVRGHLIQVAGSSQDVDPGHVFGAPEGQAELLTKDGVVTKPGPWAPIPPQRYSRPCRSRRRAGG